MNNGRGTSGRNWDKVAITFLVLVVIMDGAVALAIVNGSIDIMSFWPGM